ESLQKEQEALFQKKMANIEEAKRRAEENLANQIKKNERKTEKISPNCSGRPRRKTKN
ncbi:26187_t:CDS:2, partial [Gigaspora margarita]